MSDVEFENAGSGPSDCVPVQAGQLKKGDFVCINKLPGKHVPVKLHITAIDIFTARKYEEFAPTSYSLPSPIVKRIEYSLIDVSKEGGLSLMDSESETREDLNLPDDEELATQIREAFEADKDVTCVVFSAMGREAVMDMKITAA